MHPPTVIVCSPMNIASIHSPNVSRLSHTMRCSSSSFFMRTFFRVFYKFYRHHHENCRRILMWNFNLIHIIAETFPCSTFLQPTSHFSWFPSFAGKQQHFRPITYSRLHQLHDFRFRFCTHAAQKSRVEHRKMGDGIDNWTTSDPFACCKLHNSDCN